MLLGFHLVGIEQEPKHHRFMPTVYIILFAESCFSYFSEVYQIIEFLEVQYSSNKISAHSNVYVDVMLHSIFQMF